MTSTEQNEEDLETPEQSEEEAHKIPPVAQKVTKFGAANFQNGSKFGKWANFNPPNKQRPGRAAGRGR